MAKHGVEAMHFKLFYETRTTLRYDRNGRFDFTDINDMTTPIQAIKVKQGHSVDFFLVFYIQLTLSNSTFYFSMRFLSR